MISMRSLLEQAAREGLVDPALLDPSRGAGAAAAEVVTRHSPRGLRTLAQGSSLSVWVGAALLALFLVQADITELPGFAALLGMAGLAWAAWLVRQPLSLQTVQMAWVGAIGGQILLLTTAAQSDPSQVGMSMLALALQLVTLLLIPNLALGCAAVAASVVALFILFDGLGIGSESFGPLTLAYGAATVALWLGEASLAGGPLRRLWQPLAYTLPFATLGALTLLGPMLVDTRWPYTAGFAALSAIVIVRAGVEQPALAGAPRYVALAGVALLAAAAADAPGLSAGVMLLLLSHLRRNAALQAIALVAIGGFLFFWYYDLQTSLLTKSLAAVGNGAALLLGAAVLRRWTGQARETETHTPARRLADLRWLALALLVALALPGYMIAAKEQVLEDGRSLLLRLRPVDPRSLIQGDYMILAYEIASEVRSARSLPRTGVIVVRVDADRVARFARLDDGRPLAADEQRLRYRLRSDDLRLGAESFFFAEGTGDRYEAAAFGELMVDESGESVLIGLRDAERERLGAPLH